MPRITEEGLEYKEKKVKNLLDRVTLKLSGTRSGVFTRIAGRYKKIDSLIATLQAKRELLNESVKEHIVDLFDAEDEVLTRVVESVSLVATLSKRTPATTKTIEDFDTESFLIELYEILPDMADQIKLLQDKYTTIEQIDVAEKSPALRIKVNEDSHSDIGDKLEDYSDLVYQVIERNLGKIDARLSAIKDHIK